MKKLVVTFISLLLIIGMTSLVTASLQDIADHAVAYWQFDSGCQDYLGNMNITGSSCASAISGGGVQKVGNGTFNGISADHPDVTPYATRNWTSIEMWMSGVGASTQFAFYCKGNVYPRVSHASNDFSYRHHQSTAMNFNDGGSPANWRHLVMTHNNSHSLAYINGVLTNVSVMDSNFVTNLDSITALEFGSGSSSGSGWTGRIDNMLFTNTTYSQQDVTDAYNSSNGVDYGWMIDFVPQPSQDNLSIINSTIATTQFNCGDNWTITPRINCTVPTRSLTVTFNTTITANCSLKNISHISYDSTLNASCFETDGIFHKCYLGTEFFLLNTTFGDNNLYVTCSNSTHNTTTGPLPTLSTYNPISSGMQSIADNAIAYWTFDSTGDDYFQRMNVTTADNYISSNDVRVGNGSYSGGDISHPSITPYSSANWTSIELWFKKNLTFEITGFAFYTTNASYPRLSHDGLTHFSYKHHNNTGETLFDGQNTTRNITFWRHLVMTENGSHALKYVNGELVNTSLLDINYRNVLEGITGFVFGSGGSNSSSWNGTIDNFLITNTTYSELDVLNAYNDGFGFNYIPLLSVIGGNVSPVISVINILPVNPKTNNTLEGYCQGVDANDDNLSYQFKWYKDNIEYKSLYVNTTRFGLPDEYYCRNETGVVTSCPSELFDGNLNTYYQFPVSPTNGIYVYVNYSINPAYNFSYKHTVPGWGSIEINKEDLSTVCLSYGKQQEKVMLQSHAWYGKQEDGGGSNAPRSSVSCYNGSDYEVLSEGVSGVTRLGELYISYANLYEPGSTINFDNISSGDTIRDEEWIFGCRAYDGLNFSNWANSSTTTILNTPPTLYNVNLFPLVANTTSTLEGWCNYSDIDQDLVNVSFIWYQNEITNKTGALENQSNSLMYRNVDNITSEFVYRGANWTFSCNISDNQNVSGQGNSTTLTISDIAPEMNLTLLFPDPAFSNTTQLEGWCQGLDIDPNDKLCYYYEWHKNEVLLTQNSKGCSGLDYERGDLVNVANLTTENYTYEDNIIFSCKTNDGIFNSTQLNSSTRFIHNVPPKMNFANITPGSPVTTDNLLGFCNATNYESGNITYNFIWYRDNLIFSQGSTGNKTENQYVNVNNISSSNTLKGEEWIIGCQANDTINLSMWLNSTVRTIGNTLPNINSINISPQYPDYNDILNCSFNVTDIDDNDEVNVSITWFKNIGSGWLNVDAYDYIYENVTKNRLYITDVGNGSATEQKVNYTHWKCGINVSDNINSVYANSTNVSLYPLENLTVYFPPTNYSSNQKLNVTFSVIDYNEGIICNLSLLGPLIRNITLQTTTDGFFNPLYPAINSYDNDWNTFARDDSVALPSSVYRNYSSFREATNSTTWEVKDSIERINISIDYNCLQRPVLELKMSSDFATNESTWSCWDGTSYVVLRNEANSIDIYEEIVHWDVTNSSNVSSGVNKTLSILPAWNGNFTWNITCSSDTERESIGSENRIFFYDTQPPTFSNYGDDSSFLFPQINETITLNVTVTDTSTPVQYCILQIQNTTGFAFQNYSSHLVDSLSATLSIPYTVTSVNNKSNENVSWRVRCNDSLGNTAKSLVQNFTVVDIELPAIQLGSGNFFDESNESVISSRLYNGTLNVTFIDHNLFQAFINITCDINGTIYYWEQLDINQSIVINNDTVDLTNLPIQECQFISGASDDHTKKEIKKYKTKKLDKGYHYETQEEIAVNIIANTDEGNVRKLNTEKDMDRYTFDFEFNDEKLEREFIITADHHIFARQNSKYPGHVVVWNPDIKEGNWIDFSDNDDIALTNIDTIIEQVTDTEVKIKVRPKIPEIEIQYKEGKEPQVIEKQIPKEKKKEKEVEKEKLIPKEKDNKKGKKLIEEPIQEIIEEDIKEYITVYKKEKVEFIEENIENYDELLEKYGQKKYKFKSIGGTNILNVTYGFWIGGAVHVNSTNIFDNTTIQNITCNIQTITGFPNISETHTIIGDDGFFGNMTNGTYNFTCYNDRFFTQEYQVNVSDGYSLGNLTWESYQSILTVIVRNIKSELFIGDANVTVTVADAGGVNQDIEGNNSVLYTFFVNSTSYNITAQRAEYLSSTVMATPNYRENLTVIMDLSFVARFLFFDERTAEPFNISGVNRFEFQLVCPNRTNVTIINSTSANITIDCNYRKFNFDLFYSDIAGVDNYNRPIILDPSEALNYSIYLIDLQTTQYIYNGLIIDDLLQSYDNPRLQVNKYIGSEFVQILSDYVDVEDKVPAWFIENDEYHFFLYSDNRPVVSLGTYVAAIEGDKTIRLYQTGVSPQPSGFRQDVSFTQTVINDSDTNNRTAVLVYEDAGANTNSVVWTLRESSASGPVVYTTTINPSSNTSLTALYDLTANGHSNKTIVGTVVVDHIEQDYEHTVYLQSYEVIALEITQYLRSGFLDWFLLMVLGVMAIMGTIRTANALSLMLTVVAMFFVAFKWFMTGSPISYLAIPTLALAFLISLLSILKERSQK